MGQRQPSQKVSDGSCEEFIHRHSQSMGGPGRGLVERAGSEGKLRGKLQASGGPEEKPQAPVEEQEQWDPKPGTRPGGTTQKTEGTLRAVTKPPAHSTPSSTQPAQEHLTSVTKNLSHPTLTNNSPKSCDYPHFTDEGTKAQRKKMTSLSAQIRERWMDGRINKINWQHGLKPKAEVISQKEATYHPLISCPTITTSISPVNTVAFIHPCSHQHSPQVVPSIIYLSPITISQRRSSNPMYFKKLHTHTHTHTHINSSFSSCTLFLFALECGQQQQTFQFSCTRYCAKLHMFCVLQSSQFLLLHRQGN